MTLTENIISKLEQINFIICDELVLENSLMIIANKNATTLYLEYSKNNIICNLYYGKQIKLNYKSNNIVDIINELQKQNYEANHILDSIILKKNFIAVDDIFIKNHTSFYCEKENDIICDKINNNVIDSDIIEFATIDYLETISGELFHKKWYALYDRNSFAFNNTLMYDKEQPKIKNKFEKPILVVIVYKDNEFVVEK